MAQLRHFNPFHVLGPGEKAPEVCSAFIECPFRSKVKYELDKLTGVLIVSRILHSSIHFPANYGFVPQTYCRDHDPLDILVLSQEAVVPGCLMSARPIGLLEMVDQGFEDTKVIAVHRHDPIYAGYSDISQLPPHVLREIRHFFATYKELEEGEAPQVSGFRGRVDAEVAIRDAIQAYERFRARLLEGVYPDF
ncbi:MAG: inorganic diphosphatase [Dehalococcoidia bacterium]